MARPTLLQETDETMVRLFRRTRPTVAMVRLNPDFRVAIIAALLAVATLVAGSGLGNVHARDWQGRAIAIGAAVAFIVFVSVSVRSLANEIHRVVIPRTGPGHAAVLRLLVTLAGYLIGLFGLLALLAVPVQRLLLGGALTGIVLGIAAQQALGNIFAGLVLVLARPFAIGDPIIIRSGALGGMLTGQITGMGLTYINLETADGPLLLPNSAVLAAGIGPGRPVPPSASEPTPTPAPTPPAPGPAPGPASGGPAGGGAPPGPPP